MEGLGIGSPWLFDFAIKDKHGQNETEKALIDGDPILAKASIDFLCTKASYDL